ncbi:hypothetical protein BGAL_0185g00040 [Botrytis galanthina]|uniref:Phosphoglycerate mutase family protein n=1 Tax=Botrytis galanthina TaxID=278940 RepID=A0A4V4HUJ8_9HELO|nr:hypothetical protein BGAL_0185g00040 [Botrytis galanthina]
MPPPTTIIHVLRHAQHDDSTGLLTDEGKEQALGLANLFLSERFLMAQHITHIFCSPMPRCQQTAKIALRDVIARGIPIVTVQELSDNREVGLSFLWRHISLRERNEIMMITQGVVLKTLLGLHNVVYQPEEFPNVLIRSYLLIQELHYVPRPRLRRERGPVDQPPEYSTAHYRMAAKCAKVFVKYVPIVWFVISVMGLTIYFTIPSSQRVH